MEGSEAFGKMVAAEAHARNFYPSKRRAFLGDGRRYNWTIQRAWFADFGPIVDFVHALSYPYAAATPISEDGSARWRLYVSWMSWCWQGQAKEVAASIRELARRRGWSSPDADAPETDWRTGAWWRIGR
jgi:hypothetical protein